MIESFIEKVEQKNVTVGVIGLGYVGLPLAVSFLSQGYKVIGIDANKDKVNKLLDGESYVQDVKDEEILPHIKSGNFCPTDDYGMLKDTDMVSIAVPTPLSKSKNPDLTYVMQAVEGVLQHMEKKPYLIVLESTTYPGTTREFIVEPLIEKGFNVGEEVFVCFSPERVDPGNERFQTKNTPKVMGGFTNNCLKAGTVLYGKVLNDIVEVESLEEAEMAKLLENTFRAVNIALVNEMTLMCDRMGINMWNVIKAASSKPFGFMPFYPGPGIGGHCIPLDPQYLSWKAKTYGFFNRFIELASDINANMPRYVIEKTIRILNGVKKSVNGAKIIILGISYKKDVNDLRESPAFDIIESLEKMGATVDYSDPYFPSCEFEMGLKKSITLNASTLNDYDMSIIVTDHTDVDYDILKNTSKPVLDTRNVLKLNKELNNVHKL